MSSFDKKPEFTPEKEIEEEQEQEEEDEDGGGGEEEGFELEEADLQEEFQENPRKIPKHQAAKNQADSGYNVKYRKNLRLNRIAKRAETEVDLPESLQAELPPLRDLSERPGGSGSGQRRRKKSVGRAVIAPFHLRCGATSTDIGSYIGILVSC